MTLPPQDHHKQHTGPEAPSGAPAVSIRPRDHDAVVFDLDGVVTDTARLHAEAWKDAFDAVLRSHAEDPDVDARPFTIKGDYLTHVDGKPRLEGIRDFLASRGLTLPDGEMDDPPGRETVNGLGNRKNAQYLERLRREGPVVYPGTVQLIEDLHDKGIHTGVISASRNAREVLRRGHVADLFETCIDGEVAARTGLAGKPAPDVFLEASRRMHVAPERTVVVEDAVAGVRAGRQGGFALVIGIDRGDHAAELRQAGADVVVKDLDVVHVRDEARCDAREVVDEEPPRDPRDLPSALDHLDEVLGEDPARGPVVAFDYDGTLTPIVRHPDLARLSGAMRDALRSLADTVPVAILSGRDLDDVRDKVGLDALWYAGSHGFDLLHPDGTRTVASQAEGHVERLQAAADDLEQRLGQIEGVWVERKRFAVAVHYREAGPPADAEVQEAAAAQLARHEGLRSKPGKKIVELQPDLDWDKGHALRQTVETLGLTLTQHHVVYLGDDTTDEDGFRVLDANGAGVLVVDPEDPRDATWARYVLAGVDEVQRFVAEAARRLARLARQDPLDAQDGDAS